MTRVACDEIAQYEPHLLFLDPTHFAFLIRAALKAGSRPSMRSDLVVISAYTLCTRVARRQLREWFPASVPIADMLGMSELGYIGFECPSGNLHLNDRDYYLEFVRDGRPARARELAELIITTLDDRLAPHIRYATGDLVRLSDTRCVCGSSLPQIHFEGRDKHVLRRADRTGVTPRELDEIVGPAPWMDIYRMEQLGDDAFELRYVPSERCAGHEEAELRERLADVLGTRDIRVSAANYLPCARGGKFLSCVGRP
jgi:phenylacetate-CoA ligase